MSRDRSVLLASECPGPGVQSAGVFLPGLLKRRPPGVKFAHNAVGNRTQKKVTSGSTATIINSRSPGFETLQKSFRRLYAWSQQSEGTHNPLGQKLGLSTLATLFFDYI